MKITRLKVRVVLFKKHYSTVQETLQYHTCVNTNLLPLPNIPRLILVSPTNLKLLVRKTVCGDAQPGKNMMRNTF